MKRPYTINALASDPSVAVGLTWDADVMYIYNPTKYTVLVRQGSNSRPASILDADIVCAPAAALALPVASREFFVVLTTPTLLLAPEGMPTSCNVTFMRNEPPVAFGSMPVAGEPPADAIVLKSQAGAGQALSNTFSLPDGVGMVEVYFSGPTDLEYQLDGMTTGNTYIQELSDGNPFFLRPRALVANDLDATLNMRITVATGAWTFVVIGYRGAGSTGLYHPDARQVVDPIAPGATTVPVQTWPELPPATADVFGAQNNPGLGVVICTTGALTGGTYRIEGEVYSNDAAANGHHAILNINAANRTFITYPCSTPFVLSRVTVTAGTAAIIQNNLAVVGAQVSAAVRAYKLS